MEDWEPGAESGTVALMDDDEKEKLAEDPFYKLEHAQKDAEKAVVQEPEIGTLYKWRDKVSFDDYQMSSNLRATFRVL